MAGMLQMRRSRGAFSGFLLILLGLWGALIPFVGPYFHFAYTPDTAWTYNTARLWLELLPGAAVFLGGFLLMIATGRHIALFGALLAAAAGAWFALGHRTQPAVEQPRHHGRLAGQFDRVHADHGAARLLHRARRRHRVHRGRGARPGRVRDVWDQDHRAGHRDRPGGNCSGRQGARQHRAHQNSARQQRARQHGVRRAPCLSVPAPMPSRPGPRRTPRKPSGKPRSARLALSSARHIRATRDGR